MHSLPLFPHLLPVLLQVARHGLQGQPIHIHQLQKQRQSGLGCAQHSLICGCLSMPSRRAHGHSCCLSVASTNVSAAVLAAQTNICSYLDPPLSPYIGTQRDRHQGVPEKLRQPPTVELLSCHQDSCRFCPKSHSANIAPNFPRL